MKQHVKNVVLISSVLLIITSLNSCRKGEHDPFISFKSRDARLLGKWKLTKAEGYYEDYSFGDVVTNKLFYDGTTLTFYEEDTTSLKYSLEVEFKKKGEFVYTETSEENNNLRTETITTYWFWLDTDKKKTNLYVNLDSYYLEYYLSYVDRLSSKEMILKSNNSYSSTNSSEKLSITYTFSKK